MKRINKAQGAIAARQAGVSMIELLVAILIFAFGMLGLAGLQNKTLGFAQISLYRSQATALSDDILDRMRADRIKAKAGKWDTALDKKAEDINTTTLADRELKEWKTEVERLLPAGAQASVSYDKAKGLVTIDIRWNLWKFDVSVATTDPNKDWKVSFGGKPLFSTDANKDISAKQPIFVMPEITFHPNDGTLVSFGTGKSFEPEDTDASSAVNVNIKKRQAIYGIWDKPGETTGFAGVGKLVEQTAAVLTPAADSTLSGTTSNTINWGTQRGWYINLQAGGLGERVTVNPQQAKSVLLVLSNTPDIAPCEGGGTSRLFVLDPITGSAPTIGVLDSNNDKKIDRDDRGYNVKSFSYAVLSLPLLETQKTAVEGLGTEKPDSRGQTGVLLGSVEKKTIAPTDCNQWLLAGGSDTSITGFDIALCSTSKPRISWRQLK